MLCATCYATAERICFPFCRVCSRPYSGLLPAPFCCPSCEQQHFAFESAISAYRATGVVRELIHRFKYGRQFYLRQVLGELLWDGFLDERIKVKRIDWIVPVPLHPTRARERGFNQAEVLSDLLARRSKIPVLRCLRRERFTKSQVRFDRAERLRNLRHAFSLKQNMPVREKNLLLVDDVLTTGSTLHECAQVLRESGAASVRALTVARG